LVVLWPSAPRSSRGVNPAVEVPAELIAAGAPDPHAMSRYLPIDAPKLIPNRQEWT
jgi:hypothetical protein